MTRSRKGSYKKYKEEKTSSRIKIMKSKINYDRLSSLPDELIVSILSRLTAKEVAQTCILSKRLCNLWTLVPSLCFDIRDCNDDFKRFKEFVRKFLLKRDGARDIHSFRILCDGLETIDCLDWFSSDLSDWIKYAVEHNTRIFELSYVGYFRLDIPDCLFTCETLEDVKLKLQRWHLEELKPSAVCLPRLRKLDLTQIHFQDDHLEKILSGCPILEDLRLDDCDLQISSFSCHSVKWLQLLDPKTCQKSITVSVPCVENLVFSGDTDCRFILKSTSKLTHAIWLDGSSVEEEEHASHLLSSLSGVHDLEISSASVKDMLQGEMHKCPTFDNLKSLFIHELSVCCDFGAWTSFIKYCPNLEELYFVPDDELCDVEEEHRHLNLKQIEGFHCKDHKTVGIIYHENLFSVFLLKKLVKEWTKEIDGVEVILIKQPV